MNVKYLEYCVRKSSELPCEEYRQRLYSVVTDKRGKILGEGSNSFTKTSPMTWKYGCRTGNVNKTHTHAEILALVRTARSTRRPHSIYIGRALKNGYAGLAKPCELCRLAIKEAGIKKIIYTGTDSNIVEVLT